MTLPSEPIYIVDLNEIEDDGDTLPVSDEYTVQYGPRRKFYVPGAAPASVGRKVRIESDEDRTLFWAEIVEILGDGEYRVRIDWGSGARIMNESWAAPCDMPVVQTDPATATEASFTR